MKTKEIIIGIFSLLGILLTAILTMFNMEIKTILIDHYKLIIFVICMTALLFVGLSVFIRRRFKTEIDIGKKELEVKGDKLEVKGKQFETKGEELKKDYAAIKKDMDFIINTFKDNNQINQAICKEIIYDKVKDIGIRKTAEILYDYHKKYGIQEYFWETYLLSDELFKELKKIFIEKELENLDKK